MNSSPSHSLRTFLSSTQTKLAITIGPGLIWLLLLAVAPLLFLVVISFTTINNSYNIIWKFTFQNYLEIFSIGTGSFFASPFFHSMLISYFIAFSTTVITFCIAFPAAYLVARRTGKFVRIIIFLTVIPFFIIYLVRAYSWFLMFGQHGVMNELLVHSHIVNHSLNVLDYGMIAVIIGLVHSYFPYMFFTLYASLSGIDFSLVEAARDLGAGRMRAFRDIVLPLTTPGIVSGCIFVFVPALGAYLTPKLLAQGKLYMIGQLITGRVNKLYEINYGSAASMFIIISVIVAFVIAIRYAGLRNIY